MSAVPLVNVLASLESGARPPGGASIDSGEIPSIGGEHLNADGGFDFASLKRVPRPFYETMRGGRIVARDILVVKDGATTGKTSFVGKDFPFPEAAVNEHVFCVRVDQSKAYPEYVFHFLRSPIGQRAIALDFRGATVGGISREFARKTRLPLPPLPEQRRVAEILDKADALRAKRGAALAQLDTLTQSIFLDMFGDPAANPKGCTTRSLTSVCHCYSGGTPSKHESRYWGGHLPWFSPKDLKQDDLFESEDHVNESALSEANLKLLPSNTVAIVVRGMILAHTFPVSVLRVPATINQDLKALLPNNGVQLDPQFLAHCLRVQSRTILASVSESAHGTKRLDAEALARIAVALPSVESQREFSRRVARTEQCKAAQRTSLRQIDLLLASLQHRAFRGDPLLA